VARGWESKAIESQQEEAARGKTARRALTPEQQAAAARRQTLELSRARALDDMNRATSANHRQMLERAIAAIDEQLAQLQDRS
jgi:hypothetical protein